MYKLITPLLMAVVFSLTPPLYAQRTVAARINRSGEASRLEKEKLQELEAVLIMPRLEKEKQIIFNASGWFSTTAYHYNDTDNDISVSDDLKATWIQDLRLWASWVINQRHLIYLRIKDQYFQRTTGDGYTGNADDHDGPHLDNAYLSLSFGNDVLYELTGGRQYLYIGRGISYSAVHDGIKLLIMPPGFFIKTFLTKAINREEDIDTSIPHYDKQSDRVFAGVEIAWRGLKNNAIYGYFLLQHHLLDEEIGNDTVQAYNYDSQYIGLGFDGQNKSISYWGELIKEYGKSYHDNYYTDTKLDRKNIDAWAGDIGIRKDFDVVLSPSLELEYAFGSGDPDRVSVTDTQYGNRYGNDENFLYFGDFFSGYALETRLSNIHICKVEAAIKPFAKSNLPNWLKDMNIGTKYYWYRKDRPDGGTYDVESTNNSKDIGHEIDAFVYWKPTEKFQTILRGGVFYPGEAYPELTDTPTKYLYLRSTIYF